MLQAFRSSWHLYCSIWILEKSSIEIERKYPGQMAAERGNIEKHAKPVQQREYQHVMDHDAPLHECLNLARNPGDPIRGVFFKKLIKIAEVFIRAINRSAARSHKRGNNNSEDCADQ